MIKGHWDLNKDVLCNSIGALNSYMSCLFIYLSIYPSISITTSYHRTYLCCLMFGLIETLFLEKSSVGCGRRNVKMSSFIVQSHKKSTFCSAES